MNRTDPRPALLRCTCRHTANSHRRNSKGQRQQCTNPTCGCPRFVFAKAAMPS